MRILFLLWILVINPFFAYASDEVPKEDSAHSSAFLDSEMSAAQKEYEILKTKSGNSAAENFPKLSSAELNAMVSKITSATKIEKGTLLDDLASQVDALKNKMAIEKTTLLATQSPRKVKVTGAKTLFNYRDTAIYEVTSAIDHVTDVQLKPGETITTPPSAGDTVRWNIGVMKSGQGAEEVTHLIIKPLDEDVETNLVVTTDAHVYQLHLKSGSFHMPAVAWTYPEDFEAKVHDFLKRDESQEPTIRPEELRFTYEISGTNYDWKPVRVFDDGKKTFIQMPKSMRVTDAPALFLIEEGSDPLLVNYRVKGDYYIVDRLFENAELRVGQRRKISIEFDDGKNWLQRVLF